NVCVEKLLPIQGPIQRAPLLRATILEGALFIDEILESLMELFSGRAARPVLGAGGIEPTSSLLEARLCILESSLQLHPFRFQSRRTSDGRFLILSGAFQLAT